MHRITNILGTLSLAAALAACGGGYSGFVIPVESELKPWVAPEADELVVAEEDSADEGGYEDYEDYEDGDDSAEDDDSAAGDDEAPVAAPASEPSAQAPSQNEAKASKKKSKTKNQPKAAAPE